MNKKPRTVDGLRTHWHVHRYQRSKTGIWYCADDDCSHYIPKKIAPKHWPEGKISRCNNCQEEMQLTKKDLINWKPICKMCKSKPN